MTQTQPDRIDKLESFIERMEHKLDAIAADVQESKLEARVFQAKAEERFNSIDERFKTIDQRLERIEKRIDVQDTRTFGLIISAVVGLMGLLAKLIFFPDVKT